MRLRRFRRRRSRVVGRPELSRFERLLLSTGGIVLVLVLWQVLSATGKLDPLIWSSPEQIWNAFWDMTSDGTLGPLVLESAKLFVVSFAISIVSGILIGAIIGWYAVVRAVVDPWISLLYAMPAIALIPLLVVALGVSFETQVIVVWMVAVFPVIINVSAGVQAIDRRHLQLARSFLASNRNVLWGVAIPGAVPYMVAGIQQAIALSLIGVVGAEYFVGDSGLGGLVILASQTLQTAEAYVAVAIFAFAGLLSTGLMRYVERRVIRWK